MISYCRDHELAIALQLPHLFCCAQLQSLNMDASFLDRNVNEGFSGVNQQSSALNCMPD